MIVQKFVLEILQCYSSMSFSAQSCTVLYVGCTSFLRPSNFVFSCFSSRKLQLEGTIQECCRKQTTEFYGANLYDSFRPFSSINDKIYPQMKNEKISSNQLSAISKEKNFLFLHFSCLHYLEIRTTNIASLQPQIQSVYDLHVGLPPKIHALDYGRATDQINI